MHQRLCSTAALAILISSLAGCFKRPAMPPVPTPIVRVQQPVQRDVTDYEYFTGRIDAPETVDIRARVTGYLVKINFTPGGEVRKDQLLFKIDPRPYQAQLDVSKGQLDVAKAQLKLANAELDIAKEVAKTPGAISAQEMEKRVAEQLSAAANVEASTANVEYNQVNLDFTNVLSPVDGIVSRYYESIGNLINADTTLLTTVVSEDPMWAYFQVDERTMLRVQQLAREGKIDSKARGKAPVQLGLANEGDEFPHDGVIDFINNQVDRSTGTITVRGEFANPAPSVGPRMLKPGLFVRIRLPIGPPHPALLVPEDAVGADQGKKFLYVVDDKNIVEYRPVTMGQQQPGGLRVVHPVAIVREESGLRPAGPGEQGEPSLKAGEWVIVDGLQLAQPGKVVDVKRPASAAPAAAP